MSIFSEKRLLYYTVDQIDAVRQAAGASPLTATVGGSGVSTTDTRNLDQRVLPGGTVQGTALAASNNGLGPNPTPVPTASSLPFGNRVTAGGKAANIAAQGGASMTDAAQIGKKVNAATAPTKLPPGYIDPNSIAPIPGETPESHANRVANQVKINEDLLNVQKYQDGQQKTATPSVNPSAEPVSPGDATTASLQHLATTPETKALLSLYDQQQKDIEGLRAQNDTNLSLTRDNLNDAYDKADTRMQTIETTLKQSAEDMKGLIKTMHDQNQEALDKQQKAESDQLAWQGEKDKRTLSQQEVRQHQALVAQIALGGGFGQDGAMAAVAASDADFESKIRDVQSKLGMDQITLAAKYSALYVQNNNDYLGKSLENAKDLESKLLTIAGEENSNDIAQANAETGLVKDWFNTEVALKTKMADNTMNIVKDMQTIINQDLDHKRAKEAMAVSQAQWAVTTYGSGAKPFIDKLAKDNPGVNLAGLMGGQTLTQQNQNFDNQLQLLKLKKTGTGVGSGSNSSYTYADPTGATQQFANVTGQQLREAVDRVTQKFGGTAGERNRKRNEYLDRLSKGESAASIVSSMQSDFWATTDNPSQKAHEARNDVIAGAQLLEKYTQSYGVTPENDGPIGPVSSRLNSIGSWLGLSSDAYNDISAVAGNIRATLVHEKYGSAVTPQELALARSFIPDIHDKGPKFFANVQNLRTYTQYLDAKTFASSVGLPPPPPPDPITLNGKQPVGAGKYSPQDILSALK